MDLKITFDVTPALADVAECLCRALELRSTHAHAFHCAAAHVEPQKADAPAKAENSPVEAPEPVDVPKPAPTPENAADAESGAVAAQIDAPEPVRVEQAAEPQAEQSTEPQTEPAPVEAPKAKRSHHKKAAPEPAPSPEPVQVAEPEPEPRPAPEPQAEPAPAEPVSADTPNAPTIDDVRAVGVKLGAAGKQSVIIDYLKAHGCKSLSQLDPGCYAELIEIGKAAL